jgi:hypothetical protein
MNEPVGYALFDEQRQRFVTDRDHGEAQIWPSKAEARAYGTTLSRESVVVVQVRAEGRL